jgi:hypothetical protein
MHPAYTLLKSGRDLLVCLLVKVDRKELTSVYYVSADVPAKRLSTALLTV